MRITITTILLLLASSALATGGNRGDNEQEQAQHQGQSQEQESSAEAQAEAHASGSAEQMQNATGGEGGDSNVSMSSSNRSSNVVLVPNNNTESCLRVFGLSWGNSSGAGGIGFPWRSGACDYEQAADDAASTGDHSLAWFWRCHKRNIRKPFDRKGASKEQAIEACWRRMTQFLTADADQHTREIEYLRRELEMLREQVELTEETCDRQWESCVGGKSYE